MGRSSCIAVLSVAIAGCSGIPGASDVSLNIQRGMSYEEVFVMAGDYEMEQEFKGNAAALQFCSGKGDSTEFVTVWFVDVFHAAYGGQVGNVSGTLQLLLSW